MFLPDRRMRPNSVRNKQARRRRSRKWQPAVQTLETRSLLTLLGAAFAPFSPTEGTVFSGTVAQFVSSDGGPFFATIDWGDGATTSGVITSGPSSLNVQGTHTYLQEGSRNVSVTILDSVDGSFADPAGSIVVAEGDTLSAVAVTTGEVLESGFFGGTAAIFSDSSYPDHDPADFTATFDWGDGTTYSTSAGNATVTSDGAGSFTLAVSAHAYAEEGSYTVVATLAENAPGTASLSQTGTLTAVENDAFTPSPTPLTLTGTEGAAVSGAVAEFFDPKTPNHDPAGFQATIDWGDGTTTPGTISGDGVGGFIVSGSHAYAEDGAYVAMATIIDPAPGTASASATAVMLIAEADLSLSPSVPTFVATEGLAFSGIVAAISDPTSTDPASDYVATINWGDGTTTNGTVSGGGSAYLVKGTHTYANEGVFTVSVTVVETSAVPPATVATSLAALVVDADTLVPGTSVTANSTEGSTFSGLVATFTDTTYPGNLPSDFIATIDWGDGTTTSGTVSGSAGAFTVSGSHAYADEGAKTAVVTLSDKAPGTATGVATATIDVADAPLNAVAATMTGWEFVHITGTVAVFTDANPNGAAGDFTATVDWGDGETNSGVIAAGGGHFTVTGSHTYSEDGAFVVKVTIIDAGGSTAIVSGPMTVEEPTLSGAPVAVSGFERSELKNVPVAAFQHGAGGEPPNRFAATIAWGDGVTASGVVSESNGVYTVLGSHVYLDEGTFPVTVVVKDDSAAITLTTSAKMAEELLPDGTQGTPNQRFVQEAYRDLLHRQVDPSALSYWTNLLDHGLPRLQVAETLIKTAMQGELGADLVTGIFQKYLGRNPDPAGLAYWTGVISGQKTIEQVEAAIVGTQEFYQASGGTAAGFVTRLFSLALGRQPDGAALAAFTANLSTGGSREAIAGLVFNSHEYHMRAVAGYYQSAADADDRATGAVAFIDDLDFLDRPADANGQAALAALMDAGLADQEIWARMLASDEFFAKIA